VGRKPLSLVVVAPDRKTCLGGHRWSVGLALVIGGLFTASVQRLCHVQRAGLLPKKRPQEDPEASFKIRRADVVEVTTLQTTFSTQASLLAVMEEHTERQKADFLPVPMMVVMMMSRCCGCRTVKRRSSTWLSHTVVMMRCVRVVSHSTTYAHS
jgi:hypothetical protein